MPIGGVVPYRNNGGAPNCGSGMNIIDKEGLSHSTPAKKCLSFVWWGSSYHGGASLETVETILFSSCQRKYILEISSLKIEAVRADCFVVFLPLLFSQAPPPFVGLHMTYEQ